MFSGQLLMTNDENTGNGEQAKKGKRNFYVLKNQTIIEEPDNSCRD